jgi:hypothetical protein
MTLTLTAGSASELFARACQAVPATGRPAAPRGLATTEVLGATLTLTDPRRRLGDLPPARVINPAFAVAEAMCRDLARCGPHSRTGSSPEPTSPSRPRRSPVPGDTGRHGDLRSGDVLALFLERGHCRMRSAKLLRNLEGPHRRQRREVGLKIRRSRRGRGPSGSARGRTAARWVAGSLLLTALPLALGLDPAGLLLQQACALSGDLRRPGRATALNPDQAAVMQGPRRYTPNPHVPLGAGSWH